MSNYKMKSLFKGLRYISQIFENEKETEMQIGTPTDVKHVAHIGWDGGSVHQNSPSWMNDYKVSGGYSSMPFGDIKDDISCISEDSTRSRDRPGLPKSSRERSRRGNGTPKSTRRSNDQDGSTKPRRKKSKDSGNDGSTRRPRRRAHGSQTESGSGSMSDSGSIISNPSDMI